MRLWSRMGLLGGGNFVGKNSRPFKLRNSLHFLICAWVPIQKLNFHFKMNSIWAESNVISTGIKWHSLSKLFGFAWNRGEREREISSEVHRPPLRLFACSVSLF